MKKKFYRYAMVGILFFMTILGIKTVKAETYTGQAIWPSEFISNIYVKKMQAHFFFLHRYTVIANTNRRYMVTSQIER